MKPKGLYISPTQFVSFAEPRKTLTDHIATRERSPDFAALGMYLPNPDPILKKQGRDITVYTDLRGDAHVGGCIRRRKAAVQGLEWRVERDKASARSAKLAEEVLGKLDMRRVLHEMMDAVLYGWQPLEVLWSPPGAGPRVPMDVVGKPVQWFHFDGDAQLRFKSREAPMLGELLPPRKFLVPAQEASYANPYGFADLSMCFWPTVFKRGGLKFWVTFTEKFGTPWVVGKTPRGTPAPEQDKLLDQLEAMVQDAVGVIPDDASVDIMDAGSKTGSADLYERLLMFCRSEIAIALLGQNQSTEASSNKASATAGLEVAEDLRDGDARLCEATINQLLRWVVDSNEGEGAPAPKFELFEQKEVDEVQAKRDKTLTEAGLRFSTAYWKRTYDLQDDDIAPEVVVLPAPVGASALGSDPNLAKTNLGSDPNASKAAAAFAEPATPEPPDEIDTLINAELASWQPMLAPMVAPLQAALDAAVAQDETAAQFVERLPSVLAQLDADAVAQALTRSAFTARLGAVAGLADDTSATPTVAPVADVKPATFAEQTPPQADPTRNAPQAIHIHLHEGMVHVAAPPASPPANVQVDVHMAEQPAPVINLPAPVIEVAVAAPAITVQPADVVVNNVHPVRAVQTVERDENDEITKTITTYEAAP